jgi:hypothetical protein
MKKSPKERALVEFSKPDNLNTVTVSRVLPDNSTEPIGKVYTDLSNGEDSLIYISINNRGEEVLPPTANFIEIENRFNKYAQELAEKSFEENMKAEAEKIEERADSIKSIRNLKPNKNKVQQIIK